MSNGSAEIASTPSTGLARNAFHLGVGQIVTTILTMTLSAMVARTLGPADFGLAYLLTSIATFAYVFVDWGHGAYVTRMIALHPDRSGDLMGSVLVVRVVTAVIVGVFAVALTWALGYELRTRLLAALMICSWLPMYLGLTYSWAFRGRERMEYDALVQVVLKLSSLLFSFACLALGGRLVALIPMSAISGTITFGLAVTLYRRLGLPPLRASRATARELVGNGAPLMAIALAVAVQPYIDANILYKLAAPEVMGWYSAAWVIAGTLVAPATVLGATMYPRLSKVSTDPKEFTRTLRAAFRPLLIVAVLGAVGTYLFAEFAIGVVYSRQKFGPAASILRAFVPALLLMYVDMLFAHAILAVGKSGQLAKAKVVAVVVTTGTELMLIPWFQNHYSNGGIGIVLALACGELVMVSAAVFLIREMVDKSMGVEFVRGLAAGVGTVMLMLWFPPIHPLLGIPLSVFTFLAASFSVGLVKAADVKLLATMVRRRQPLPAEGTSD